MASIIPGPMAAVIRGSIGGTTFSRNSAGDYVRNRTKPVYPGTPAQMEIAGYLATLVEAWQGLTVAQRGIWEAKRSSNTLTNAVSQQIVGSGFNLYMRANLSLMVTDQPIVVMPPTPMVIDTPKLTLLWTDTLGIQVTSVHGWAPTYTDRVQISYLTKQRQSIVFHKGPYENTFPMGGISFRSVPVTIVSDSDLLSDTRAFFRFKVVVDTGAISSAWTQHVDVGTITP